VLIFKHLRCHSGAGRTLPEPLHTSSPDVFFYRKKNTTAHFAPGTSPALRPAPEWPWKEVEPFLILFGTPCAWILSTLKAPFCRSGARGTILALLKAH
jgi:hypothetical protein